MSKGEEPFALERMIKGYLLACIVAEAVFVFSVFVEALSSLNIFWEMIEKFFPIIFMCLFEFAFAFAFVFAFVVIFILPIAPATFVLIFAEINKIREFWYYFLFGVAVGLWGAFCTDFIVHKEFEIVLCASGGALAGLVYWRIAGRDAGRGIWPRF